MAKSNDTEKDAELNEKESKQSEKKTEKKVDKKADKNKKPNIFVRFGRKIKETFSELKRVTWPTLPTVLKSTGVVLVIVAVFLVVATGINYGFSALLQLLTDLA